MSEQPTLPGLAPASQTRRDDTTDLPAWIREQLQAATWPTRRAARFHRCPDCNAIVLTGLDGDNCAFTSTTDPTPITRQLEIACLLAGRRTYTAWRAPNGYELTYRHPSTPEQQPILPEHRCGARFPGFLTPRRERTTRHGWPDQPTF